MLVETFGGVWSSVLRVLEPSLSSGDSPELFLPLFFLPFGGVFLVWSGRVKRSQMVLE